ESHSPIRGEGPFAPEVVVNGIPNGMEHDDRATVADSEISDETGTHSTTRSILSPVSPMSPHNMTFQPLVAPPPPKTKPPPTSIKPTLNGIVSTPKTPAAAPAPQPNASLLPSPLPSPSAV